MLKVADFRTRLPEAEHKTLANRLGAGLLNAPMAAQCRAALGAKTQNVAQLLAYLSDAIRQLEAAQELVRRWAQISLRSEKHRLGGHALPRPLVAMTRLSSRLLQYKALRRGWPTRRWGGSLWCSHSPVTGR